MSALKQLRRMSGLSANARGVLNSSTSPSTPSESLEQSCRWKSRDYGECQFRFCLFTDPELARIGLNETEARASGTPYRLAKIPMAADLRTRTLSETRGFMKALIDTTSDRILGFTVFGVGGGEIMGAVQIAMIAGLPYTALREAVLAHPTLIEGLVALFSAAVSGHNVVETRRAQTSAA